MREKVVGSNDYWQGLLRSEYPYACRGASPGKNPFKVYLLQRQSTHLFMNGLHPKAVSFPTYQPPFERFAAHGFSWARRNYIAAPAERNTKDVVIQTAGRAEHAHFTLPEACWQILYSPTTDGGALLCGHWKGNISVYSIAKQKIVQTWAAPEYSSFRMDRCEWEGKPAIVVGGKKIRVLDPADGRLLHAIDLGSSYTAIHDLVTVKMGRDWVLLVKYLDLVFAPHVLLWNLSKGAKNHRTLTIDGGRPRFVLHEGFQALVTSQGQEWLITEFRPDKVAN